MILDIRLFMAHLELRFAVSFGTWRLLGNQQWVSQLNRGILKQVVVLRISIYGETAKLVAIQSVWIPNTDNSGKSRIAKWLLSQRLGGTNAWRSSFPYSLTANLTAVQRDAPRDAQSELSLNLISSLFLSFSD